MDAKSIIILMMLLCLICFGMPDYKSASYGTGIARAEDDNAYAQRLIRDLEEAVKSGNQELILDAHRRVQSHESARFMLNQKPALLRQLGQVQQSIKSPPTVAGAPTPAPAVSAAPASSRVSVPADSALPSSGGSKLYNLEGTGYQGSIQVDTPASGSGSVTSYSQARANIHDIAQKINPQPPDPTQVKEWADSIRRPGSSEPPKQIEKFSGGDPSWSEINKRVTAASEPLYSKDRTIAVRDPDLARLVNREQNYTKGSVDPELARLASKEPQPPARPSTPASAEIIGRGPGGTGVIVPPGVKDGANTMAGPPVLGPAMDETALNMEGLVSQRAQAMDQTTIQSGQGRSSPSGQAMDQTRLGRLSQPGQAMDQTVKIMPPGVNDAAELNRSGRASDTGVKGPGPADTGAYKPISDQPPTGQTPLTKGVSSFQAQPTLVEEATGAVRNAADRVTEAGRDTVSGIQKADAALGRGLGVGELPPDASRVRSGLNTGAGNVLGAAAVVGTGLAAESLGEKGGTGLQDYLKGQELQERAQTERQAGFEQRAQRLETQADRFQNQGKDKMLEAAKDEASLVGGIVVGGAIGAAAPVAGTIVGGGTLGYSIGRYGMENTETGRALDKLKEDYLDEPGSAADSLYRGWERLKDQAGGFLGGETGDQRKSRERKELQETFQRALDDGQLKLQPGVERDDLMAYLQIANLGRPDDRKGLDDFLAGSTPPPGQVKENVAPAGTETAGTGPVKSRQELDLEAYQALQALEKIKKDAEEKPVDKQTTPEAGTEKKPDKDPVVEPETPVEPPVVEPEKTPVDTTKGNTGSDGANMVTNDPSIGVDPDLVSKLQNAEKRTGGAQSAGSASDSGLQLALNTNITGSVQQDLDKQRLLQFDQIMGSIGGTQAERAAAAQNQQMIDQSRVQAQGQQTGQAISANAQEVVAAQQTLQMTRQNSLGNILLDSLMGGFTSGVAVGIDRFGSIVGSAAGQQASGNWGILTPPVIISTPQTGTGSTGSQTGDAQTGSTSQSTTPTTTITPPTTGTGSTATSTGSGTRTTTQTAGTSSGGTTQISRPPVKPPATGGTKSCRVAGTCRYTGYADKNGCCTVCGKKVAKK